MQTYALTNVARQIDQIRREVRSGGFSLVGCEQLDFLCEGRGSEKERTHSLKQIGEWENWSVGRKPNGKVLFSAQPWQKAFQGIGNEKSRLEKLMEECDD